MDSNRQQRPRRADEDLIREMLAGSEDAFIMLFRRHQQAVYRFSLQMSGSESVAEDVTQEVFLTLMRVAGNYDSEKGTLASFLYGIARNHVLRRMGSERQYVAISDEELPDVGITGSTSMDNPMLHLARSEEIKLVRSAIVSLPPHYREVVVLCDLHELDYTEASRILDCPVGTVRSRLHRARKLLLEKLTVDHRQRVQCKSARYMA